VHLGVAVALTGLAIVLSTAVVLATFGIVFATHGMGSLIGGGLGVLHWWGALLVFLAIVAVVTVRLVTAPSDARMPRNLLELDADHRARATLARLAALADMPTPVLVAIDSEAANSFVVDGPGHPVTIVVTTTALTSCPPDELEAMLAHELFHVAHGDTGLTRRLEQLADIADDRAPRFIASYVMRAVRTMMRQRELSADRAAALLTGRPSTLLAAIERCSGSASLSPTRDLRAAMSVGFVAAIVKPRSAAEATHPTLQQRSEVLARVASSLGG
jgi:Zn-dependent protease with chaperone function